MLEADFSLVDTPAEQQHPQIQQQDEVQMDIYYQGTPDELMSLIYPLHSPSDSIFKSLNLVSTTYQPIQKTLEMHYLPDNVQNTELPNREILYKSKLVANRTNYFLSSVVEERPGKNCLVWRSIAGFLQMRPTKQQKPRQTTQSLQEATTGTGTKSKQQQRSSTQPPAKDKSDALIQDFMMRRDGGRLMEKKMKSHAYVKLMHESEPKLEVKVIKSTDKANTVLHEIEAAPHQPQLPIINKLSRLEYRNALSK